MKYTARFAHCKKVYVKVGDTLNEGDKIGKMGHTGTLNAHVHMDVVQGYHKKNWTLYDMEMEIVKADLRQLNYFIDDELFKIKPVITTPIADYDYQNVYGKLHLAYDVVPADRHVTDEHYDFYWNRTKKGKVLAVVEDKREKGYGNYVLIGYEA